MGAQFNLAYYERSYFYYDYPVEYVLRSNQTIKIYPVKLIDSEKFLVCSSLLTVDKNAYPSAEVIQMSYLEFIYKILLQDEVNRYYLATILNLCLGFHESSIFLNEYKKANIIDKETGIIIDSKDFDNIKQIILYQNILDYDDSYISPELKQAMEEENALRNNKVIPISLERKIAIITSHCGLSKKDQLEMTYRSHSLLFKEVCGEVEFTTMGAVQAMFGDKKKEFEHWIFKKEKDKLDGYLTDINTYTQALGGEGSILSSNIPTSSTGEYFDKLFESYKSK